MSSRAAGGRVAGVLCRSFFVVVAALGATGCDRSNPVGVHRNLPSQVTVGPLTVGTWLPFGLTGWDLRRLAGGFARDLHFNQIQMVVRRTFAREEVAPYFPDITADSLSAEQVASLFAARERLQFPLYLEPGGFGDHDKLENWATCNFPTRFAVGCENDPAFPEYEARIRSIVRAHHDLLGGPDGSMAGVQGYLVFNEIMNKDGWPRAFYPALAEAIRIARDEDAKLRGGPSLPALAVGVAKDFTAAGGSTRGFMEAFFGGGLYDPPNIFQQDHYVFARDVPFEADDPEQKGAATVQDRLDLLLQGYDEVCRYAVEFKGRWHAIVQAHEEERGGRVWFRAPLPSEIRVQVGLALSRGASGILYFIYGSGREGRAAYHRGLVDEGGNIADPDRYAAVRDINRDLRAVSAELAPLFFRRAISWNGDDQSAPIPRNRLLRGVSVAPPGGGRLEFGLFGGAEATHLLVVNRRTHARQTVQLLVAAEPVSDAVSNERLAVEDAFARKLRSDRKLTLELAPGGFRLLRFE